jgi:asparaginyl-tRNA synthetase
VEEFLRGHGFKHLDPNVLTASDCEGAGEMFTVGASIPDFFGGKRVGLTVSSQLQLEALVPVGSGVYTLNKSFRAEKSNTSRHLAEFTHLEWESKVVDTLDRLMDFNEDLIVSVLQRVLAECSGELATLNSFVSKGIVARLEGYLKGEFARISYTEAIALLERDRDQFPEGIPKWGDDLGSRYERYLAEVVFGKPVFVYNYPRDLKSFYMKQNPVDESGRVTVQGCDLLMPYMGELIGSSVREENADRLVAEMGRRGMEVGSLAWYVDLRKNGGCRTSGAGIGFERLLQVICFMESNIRDVIPFPVAYGECGF